MTATLVLTLTDCNKPNTTINELSVDRKGTLTVAMDVEMPGYFELEDVNYGYQYDLLKAYADFRGVKLEVIAGKSPAACTKLLMTGKADMAATLTTNLSEHDKPYSVPVYNTSYVLLGAKGKALSEGRSLPATSATLPESGMALTATSTAFPENPAEGFPPTGLFDGRTLLVSSAFQDTKAYSTLLDSLPKSHIYVTSRNGFDLMDELVSGETDFVICEISEAHIGTALTKGIEQIYTFPEEVSLSAVVSPLLEGESERFRTWLDDYRLSPDYAMLNHLYFEKGIIYQLTDEALRSGGISAYDMIFREICDSEGYDWRLIAAIAYNESRFDPDVVSRSGARGLMQVMPAVARQFDVEGDIMSPDVNVLLGVKILGRIEESLKFKADTHTIDRMKIILACYNAGIGHVMDARNLAVKYGADPDSWEQLSVYIRMKGTQAVANESVVKHGRFRSGETLAFVEGVMAKYGSYCRTTSL